MRAPTDTNGGQLPQLGVPRRVRDPQRWEIVSDLSDPLLGLGAEQLADTWGDLGIDEEPSEADALAWANAAHAVISHVVGRPHGRRESWGAHCRALFGTLISERCDEDGEWLDGAFTDLGRHWEAVRDERTIGWGTGASALGRLHEHCAGHGNVAHHRARRSERAGWTPSHAQDFTALERAWQVAQRNAPSDPRLAVEVCGAFAAPRRLEVIAEQAVLLPSVWEGVACAMRAGPQLLSELAAAFLSDEAARGLAASTLEHQRSMLGSWTAAFAELAAAHPVLEQWAGHPSLLLNIPATAETPQQRRRTAVPRPLWRRARTQLVHELESRRRKDGTVAPSRSFLRLRALLLHDLVGQTAARISEIAAICPAHVSGHQDFGDGLHGPAVWITPRKRRRTRTRRALGACWRPIHPSTYGYLQEWLTYCGLDPADDRQSIWASTQQLTSRLTAANLSSSFQGTRGSNRAEGRGIIPEPGSCAGYGAHRVRHLGEILAYGVGVQWNAAHPEWELRVSPQVHADAFLCHAPRTDTLGYKDLVADHQLWAARAALGDPERGIPGVIDLLIGDAGARRGWDTTAVASAARRLDQQRARLAETGGTLAAARLDVREADERALPRQDERALSQEQLLRYLLARNHALESRDRDRRRAADRVERAREDRDQAQREVDLRHAELGRLRDRGPSLVLDDRELLAGELAAAGSHDRALDTEGWEEVLSRLGIDPEQITTEAISDGHRSLHIRRHLNPQEMAAVCGLTTRTLARWLADPASSPLPARAHVTLSARRRAFNIDAIGPDQLATLLSEQRELLDTLLMVQMGTSRWGGASIPEIHLDSAEAA